MGLSNKKIALIGGARPNFMKIAPLAKELAKRNIDHVVINTGQHFDNNMAANFFEEFNLRPDISLNPSSYSVITQITDIMNSLEKIFDEQKINLVIVVGDVNSTLAAALVANKMGIKLAHVEAGLRSNNKLMPEEHNRIIVDHISDYLFVTMEEGVINLKKEGVSSNVYLVGNIMIDTLVMALPQVGDTDESFYFCTLHRGENVDNRAVFTEILDALEVISKDNKIYLPLHPRTKKMAEKFGLMQRMNHIFNLLDPLSYEESLFYQKNAKLVLTDSGGVQEETTFLGTPCITLRKETERPITVTLGTNTIGGVSKQSILAAYNSISFNSKKIKIPLWDGRSSERIINYLQEV